MNLEQSSKGSIEEAFQIERQDEFFCRLDKRSFFISKFQELSPLFLVNSFFWQTQKIPVKPKQQLSFIYHKTGPAPGAPTGLACLPTFQALGQSFDEKEEQWTLGVWS